MKLLNRMPFRRQLTVALMLISIAITLYTSLFSYRLANRQFSDMSNELTQSGINMLRDSIEDYFTDIIDITADILSSPSLRKISELEDPDPQNISPVWQSMDAEIRSGFKAAKERRIQFSATEIHFSNGLNYSTEKELIFHDYRSCTDYMSEITGKSGGYVGIHWLTLNSSSDSVYDLWCLRYIYNSRMIPVGVALFSVNHLQVEKLISPIDSAVIMDTSGRILAASDRNKTGTGFAVPELLSAIAEKPGNNTFLYTENNEEHFIYYAPVGTVNSYLVVPNTAYEDLLKSKTALYKKSVVLLIISGLLISALVAFSFSKSMSTNMKKLTDFIHTAGKDENSEARYTVSGNTEYDQIGKRINEMLDSIQEEEKKRADALKLTQALELRLLQAQLNPHLLYNTLNSVLWNLKNRQDDNAEQLIASLSGYFQYALSDGRQCIPLRDELKLIECYLDLQHLARHKSFTFTQDIPEEILKNPIPKLSLQPLVENSIEHGFDGYRDDGIIHLKGETDGNVIKLYLSDNGFGMTQEELSELNQMFGQELPLHEIRSFGLYGINRTIRQLYGPGYGLMISSEVDRYTMVTVTIPVFSKEKEHDNVQRNDHR